MSDQLQAFLTSSEAKLAFNYVFEDGYDVHHDARLKDFADTERWINGLFFPGGLAEEMPLFVATWARNLISGYLLYFGFGLLWSYVWYVYKRSGTFPFGGMPRWKDINKHISVSSKALVWYTFFPAAVSWCI